MLLAKTNSTEASISDGEENWDIFGNSQAQANCLSQWSLERSNENGFTAEQRGSTTKFDCEDTGLLGFTIERGILRTRTADLPMLYSYRAI